MAEELVAKILGENDTKERLRLMRDYSINFSNDEVIRCIESFDLFSLLENYSEFEDFFGSYRSETDIALTNILKRDGINEIKNNKEKLIEFGMLDTAIEVLGSEPRGLVDMLKADVDIKDIVNGINLSNIASQIDLLSEEDKKIVVDRLYIYLSDDLVRQVSPERMESIDEDRVNEVMQAENLTTNHINFIKNMNESDFLKIASKLSDFRIVQVVKDMSIETRLKIIEDEEILSPDFVTHLAEDMGIQDKLRVIEKRKDLVSGQIEILTNGMDTESKLKAIGFTVDRLIPEHIIRILGDRNKLQITGQEFSEDDIVDMAEQISDEDRVVLITQYVSKLSVDSIIKISEKMGDESKARIVGILGKLNEGNILEIVEKMNIHFSPQNSFILEKFKEEISDNPLKDSIIELLKEGKIGIRTAKGITTENEVKFCGIYGELGNVDRTGVNTIPNEKIDKLNRKHVRNLKKMLEGIGVQPEQSAAVALNLYCTMGFERGKEILEGKYGEIQEEQIVSIFRNINLSELTFNAQGTPDINTEIVNLALGQNHRVNEEASPLKLYLKGNCSEQISQFFEKFGLISSEWDRIKEEIDRKKLASKVEVRRNVASVVDVLKIIEQQEFIPETVADFKLAKTDIHQYVGKDTQYTQKPEKAVERAYDLSRQQENCKTKKFPDVRVENQEEQITCSTYSPQDRTIMTAGYKSGCCFRPNGNADSFGNDKKSLMRYCLTSEYAGGIKVEMPNKESGEMELVMFSPILRNGNMLMIHSVETMQKDNPVILSKINQILEQYAMEVLEQSKEAEGPNGIQAVLITDLHEHRFNLDRSKGTLTEKFQLHNDASLDTYTNLGSTTHHVLAKNAGVTEKDLNAGDVEHSYEFSEQEEKSITAFSKEECQFIRQYNLASNEITRLVNDRKEMKEQGRTVEADRCLAQIKSLRKDREGLRKKCKTGIGALDRFRFQQMAMNEVLTKTEPDMSIDDSVFPRVMVGGEYFIAVTENQEIITECTAKGTEDRDKDLEKIKDFIGGEQVKVFGYREYAEQTREMPKKMPEKLGQPAGPRSIHELQYEGGGCYER